MFVSEISSYQHPAALGSLEHEQRKTGALIDRGAGFVCLLGRFD